MKNRYYLIEPIDIDGDKNPDGFLVSQYRIDKNGNKIFLKNKYITYKLFKEKVFLILSSGTFLNQSYNQLSVLVCSTNILYCDSVIISLLQWNPIH